RRLRSARATCTSTITVPTVTLDTALTIRSAQLHMWSLLVGRQDPPVRDPAESTLPDRPGSDRGVFPSLRTAYALLVAIGQRRGHVDTTTRDRQLGCVQRRVLLRENAQTRRTTDDPPKQ